MFSRFFQRVKKKDQCVGVLADIEKNNHTDLSSWPERLESRPVLISIPFDFFWQSFDSLVFDFPKWPNRNSRHTEIDRRFEQKKLSFRLGAFNSLSFVFGCVLQFFPGFSTIQRIFKISEVSENVEKTLKINTWSVKFVEFTLVFRSLRSHLFTFWKYTLQFSSGLAWASRATLTNQHHGWTRLVLQLISVQTALSEAFKNTCFKALNFSKLQNKTCCIFMCSCWLCTLLFSSSAFRPCTKTWRIWNPRWGAAKLIEKVGKLQWPPQLEKVPVPNKFTLCRLAACCSNFGGRLTQDLDWNRLEGLFVYSQRGAVKARSGFPCVKKTPQLGPKMAPKLGFQFEAPTWVALYVHTGNPKSRARFRCPELSCFWNRFELNNNWNRLTDNKSFFDSILFASTLKKTKTPSIRVFLAC